MNTDPTSNDPYGPVANVYDAMGDRPKPTDPLLALSPLLPCPFCGENSAYLCTPSGTDRDVAIRCNGCGVMTRTFKSDPVNFSGNESAISAWNARTTNAHSDEAEAAAIDLLRHRLCNDEDGWRALLTLLDALAYRKEMHRAANARGDGAISAIEFALADAVNGQIREAGFNRLRAALTTPGSEVQT